MDSEDRFSLISLLRSTIILMKSFGHFPYTWSKSNGNQNQSHVHSANSENRRHRLGFKYKSFAFIYSILIFLAYFGWLSLFGVIKNGSVKFRITSTSLDNSVHRSFVIFLHLSNFLSTFHLFYYPQKILKYWNSLEFAYRHILQLEQEENDGFWLDLKRKSDRLVAVTVVFGILNAVGLSTMIHLVYEVSRFFPVASVILTPVGIFGSCFYLFINSPVCFYVMCVEVTNSLFCSLNKSLKKYLDGQVNELDLENQGQGQRSWRSKWTEVTEISGENPYSLNPLKLLDVGDKNKTKTMNFSAFIQNGGNAGNGNSDPADAIQKIIKGYEITLETVKIFNEEFGLRILSLVLPQMYAILVALYFFIFSFVSEEEMDEGFVIQARCQISLPLFFLFIIYKFAASCHDLTNNALDIQNSVTSQHFEFLRRENVLDEIKFLISKIVATPPKISPCGFFTVNRQFLTSVCAAVTTYVVVLAQFKSNQTHQSN